MEQKRYIIRKHFENSPNPWWNGSCFCQNVVDAKIYTNKEEAEQDALVASQHCYPRVVVIEITNSIILNERNK